MPRIAPRFLLGSFLAGLPVGIGFYVFVLPGIYLLGRLMLTGPALVAGPPLGAGQAVGRSWQLTRGAGLPLSALAAIAVLAGAVAPAPFLMLGSALRSANVLNPVALGMIYLAAAAASAAAGLALLLIEVAVWRQLGQRG